MAKGSIRKRGKKWYYRFYIKDATGKIIQKEYAGTVSKRETERLLREAMVEYERTSYITKANHMTLSDLLDVWLEDETQSTTLSNGTISLYTIIVGQLKQFPICSQRLHSITSSQLQTLMDLIVLGGTFPDGNIRPGYSTTYSRAFSTILKSSFEYAIFPMQALNYNPMQYVSMKKKNSNTNLFSSDDEAHGQLPVITHEQYQSIIAYLKSANPSAILPIQIAYYSGLRLGEVCGLSWNDINLEEQFLVVRRSIKYNRNRHITEIGSTKRKKIRTVDFGDTLACILSDAKSREEYNRLYYGPDYFHTFYHETSEKNRSYFEYHHLTGRDPVPSNYVEIPFVCRHPDGKLETPNSLSHVCRTIQKKLPGLENFHFHLLRHTYTTNLLASGAAPKDVQELLGHSDVSTTMNVYAHSTREAKQHSAKLLDKLSGN